MTRGHLLVIDDSPTVLKVIELAMAEAGHRVAAVPDDDAAVAWVRQERTVPDLILLDGMIPSRDAAQACFRFAADAMLARVPVVVMAARGQAEELEAKLAKVRNVVDTIAKPFSPEALLAVVSRVVRPSTAVSETAAATGDTAAAALARETVRAAVDEALARSATVDAAGTLAEARAFAEAGLTLAGDLGTFSSGEIMELVADKRESGIVRVVNTETNARVALFFREGQVDFASAVGVAEELLLGRFVVGEGAISKESVDALVAERARSPITPPPFGADLVARGLVTREVIGRALARQTSELAFETLRWREGFFQLRRTDELPPLARDASLGLSVDRMLLEGYRRVDEWRIIEREVSGFDEIFVRNDHKIGDLPRGTLTRDELAVLEQIDGRQSVREVMRKLRMGSFDLSSILFRLRRVRLVRKRVPPVAA
jgi:DNA-binding response OmpR family regulator